MTSYTAAKAAAHLDELIERVTKNGEPVRITRGKKVIGGFVRPEDLELLQSIRAREDAEDIAAADAEYKQYKKDGKSVPWEKIKKKHGL